MSTRCVYVRYKRTVVVRTSPTFGRIINEKLQQHDLTFACQTESVALSYELSVINGTAHHVVICVYYIFYSMQPD